MAQMLAAGLTVAVTTDDPPMFGTDLTAEYHAVARVAGLGEASFMPPRTRRALPAEITALTAAAEDRGADA